MLTRKQLGEWIAQWTVKQYKLRRQMAEARTEQEREAIAEQVRSVERHIGMLEQRLSRTE